VRQRDPAQRRDAIDGDLDHPQQPDDLALGTLCIAATVAASVEGVHRIVVSGSIQTTPRKIAAEMRGRHQENRRGLPSTRKVERKTKSFLLPLNHFALTGFG
jgi:hypothetical protein